MCGWLDKRTKQFLGAFLTASLAMAVLIVADPRQLDGQVIWTKPLKFCISMGIYVLTWSFIAASIHQQERRENIRNHVLTAVLVLQSIITLQAARGVRSHFNTSTELDTGLYLIMGTAVAWLSVTHVRGTLALHAEAIIDPLRDLAARYACVLFCLGLLAGAVMSVPSLQEFRVVLNLHLPMSAGGHSLVNRPDDALIPWVGWSQHHGDFRPAHAVGLHALQLIPLLGLLLDRVARRQYISVVRAQSLLFVSSCVYGAVVAILIAQAYADVPCFELRNVYGCMLVCLCLGCVVQGWLSVRRGDAGRRVP